MRVDTYLVRATLRRYKNRLVRPFFVVEQGRIERPRLGVRSYSYESGVNGLRRVQSAALEPTGITASVIEGPYLAGLSDIYHTAGSTAGSVRISVATRSGVRLIRGKTMLY
jgi:hypothetical protein